MADDRASQPVPRLSELLEEDDGAPTSRRRFLGQASLSLVFGGAALAACREEAKAPPTTGGAGAVQGDSAARFANPNSRLDSALHREPAHGNLTTVPPGVALPAFRRFDPALPPLPSERTLRLHWRAQEVPVRISADTVVAAWTFEGDIPGPVVHCRVGDTVEFTLTNEGMVPHSIDFHAAQIDPRTAFRSVTKGQSVQFSFKPKWAGVYMYHCGSSPVLMHIGSGMYGAIVVSPATPLAPAKE
ncbi:MAG TPA: multicopper oxidase domain-containing protein, partial [Gemmatimonadales bacterium]